MGKEQDLLLASKNGDYAQVKKLLGKLKKSVSTRKEEPKVDDAKMKKSKSQSAMKKSAKVFNINATDDEGFTPLHYAALVEKPDICRDLLEMDAEVAVQAKNGTTPLHLAGWAGRVDQSRLLLRSGANANALSTGGETALLSAAQYGKNDVAAVLLEYKADVGVVSGAGMTALDKACQFGHLEMVKLLIQAGALSFVKPLTAEEKTDPSRHTPLHLAAKHGHIDIIKALLAGSVCVNLETANGTALHEAALYGRRDIVKFLVDNAIDVNVYNSFQQTALDIVQHFVKSSAAVEMKTILMESGCINVVLARAQRDHHPSDSSMLSFSKGDSIVILEQNANGPWKGSVGDGDNKRTGFFSKSAVSVVKRPESTVSIASIATQGGQTIAAANLPESDSLYDVLQPKRRSDMPSPPPPKGSVSETSEPHQYGTLSQAVPRGPTTPLMKDDPFTGQYLFDDVSPPKARRQVKQVQAYEEVELKDVVAKQKQQPQDNYSQIQFLSSGNVIHQRSAPVSYADIVLPGVSEEKSLPRATSLSQMRNQGSYENVEVNRRSSSMSQPRPIPPKRGSPGQVQRYENIVLPSEIGKLASPSNVSAAYQGTEEEDEVYEVMGARKSSPVKSSPVKTSMAKSLTIVSPDVSGRVSLHPGAITHRRSDASESSYELMEFSKDATPSISPRSVSPTLPSQPSRHLQQVQPIGEWCSRFDLTNYTHILLAAGFDDTTFLVDITDEILCEIGVQDVEHRKRMLTLIPETVAPLSIFPQQIPASVQEWLTVLRMSSYLDDFTTQGYDNIEFVTDLTADDLKEINITKPGHIHKLLRGGKHLTTLEDTANSTSGCDATVPADDVHQTEPTTALTAPSDIQPVPPKRRTKAPPPPKPRRPTKGAASPPFDKSAQDNVAMTDQQSPPPSDAKQGIPPAPPKRRDSFKKTKDQIDRLRTDMASPPVPEEEFQHRGPSSGKEGKAVGLPPPPPPMRGDSLQPSQQPATVERSPTPPPLPPPPEPIDLEGQFPTDGLPVVEEKDSRPRKPPPPVPPKPSTKPKPPAVAPRPSKKPVVAVAVTVPEPSDAVLPPPPPPVVEADEAEAALPEVGEFTLEDAIKQALRSPKTGRKEVMADFPLPPSEDGLNKHDDVGYEPATSDQLMDDLDHMLEDLNRELDELIPGI
eukprot:m.70153 g.70153  ORF g.70153 m.70153 type:complete len:1160 (+) comp35661_c0_seq2:45-3524(+)